MAKKPFSKSFGFFHSFSSNFLVLYMVTGATPPDSWGHCTSLLYCSPLPLSPAKARLAPLSSAKPRLAQLSPV